MSVLWYELEMVGKSVGGARQRRDYRFCKGFPWFEIRHLQGLVRGGK